MLYLRTSADTSPWCSGRGRGYRAGNQITFQSYIKQYSLSENKKLFIQILDNISSGYLTIVSLNFRQYLHWTSDNISSGYQTIFPVDIRQYF